MRILIAPDKFKDCRSAARVAEVLAGAFADVEPTAVADRCPLSDGGEGFVETMIAATGGRMLSVRVTGPLPDMKVDAAFGMLGDGKTAVIEMAAASGLALLSPSQRNPMHTTTFGTGELILAALDAGAEQILLGIGGSATNDGGLGAAQACGLPILMNDGEPVSPTDPLTAADLQRVMFIKHGRGSRVDRVPITVACDVTNPLLGPNGASGIYGPQKGASPQQIDQLESWLSGLVRRTNTLDTANAPGAGAAGGLGWGLLSFFNARLRPGIEIVLDATGFQDRLNRADLCITGEGKFDASSLEGKVVGAVLNLAEKANVPCIIIAGNAQAQSSARLITLAELAGSSQAAMQDAEHWLKVAAGACLA